MAKPLAAIMAGGRLPPLPQPWMKFEPVLKVLEIKFAGIGAMPPVPTGGGP